MPPIGLICALQEELEAFGSALIQERNKKFSDNVIFCEGKLDGHEIVWIKPGVTIGKVSAAAITALLKSEYDISTLIFSGVAGSMDPELDPGDIVIADEVIIYDYGHYHSGAIKPYRSGVNFIAQSQEGVPLAFAVSDKVRHVTQQVIREFTGDIFQGRKIKLVSGTILTGDVFLNDGMKRKELHDAFNAKAIEMEGGAILQAAELCGIEHVYIIRALSDLAGDDSHLDFVSLLHHAAKAASKITRTILKLDRAS